MYSGHIVSAYTCHFHNSGEESEYVASISGILSTLLGQGIEKSDSMLHLYDTIKNDHEYDGIFVVLRLENWIYLNNHNLVWLKSIFSSVA